MKSILALLLLCAGVLLLVAGLRGNGASIFQAIFATTIKGDPGTGPFKPTWPKPTP